MNEFIQKLTEANNQSNDGRGLSCIRSILFHLNQGDIDSAKTVYQTEGDKINSFPELQKILEDELGCRLHFMRDCQDWLCSSLRKYRDQRLES